MSTEHSQRPVIRLDSPPGPATGDDWNVAGINAQPDVRDDGGDPLAAIESLQAVLAAHAADWPGARFVGYFSYDLGRMFETLADGPADDLNLPLFSFSLIKSPESPGRMLRDSDLFPTGRLLQSTLSKRQYLIVASRAVEYIRAGDIFQVNLSQRFTVSHPADPLTIYQRLHSAAPASYGALLDYGDFALICNSPELFFRVEPLGDGRRRIVTRPIKGTRPLLPGMDSELRDSVKDQAELNMIVDLERNDLGRICEIGSVKVTQPRMIEAHPTLYHGVATIEGMLRPEVGLVDILRAMFPGGSITGAPKIRAMQIIDKLEPVRRGPYCGAIGWIGANGAMEFNIAIRTMIVKKGLIHVSVGGGIVADSDPEAEYEETLVKARAMLTALGVPSDAVRQLGQE